MDKARVLEGDVVDLIDRESASMSREEYGDFLSSLISTLELREEALKEDEEGED